MHPKPCASCGAPQADSKGACPSCGRSAGPEVTAQELEHLRLLTIFHYIVGGITFLFACFPLMHVAFGILMATGSMENAGHEGKFAPPRAFGLFIALFGCAFVGTGWVIAGSMIAAGRFIAARKRHTFCIVVAAVSCIFMPFGTVLGVFTLIMLSKPQVKALFGAAPPSTPT